MGISLVRLQQDRCSHEVDFQIDKTGEVVPTGKSVRNPRYVPLKRPRSLLQLSATQKLAGLE